MAFGFNDFAKFFDPVSDLLGTSGKKGVGLFQQKPEDIAMTAAAIYLATNGIPVTPESVAAVEASGTAEAAAAEQAARLAAEKAAAQEAARLAAEKAAAQEATQRGIVNSTQTADTGGSFFERLGIKGKDLRIAGEELSKTQYTPKDFGYLDVNAAGQPAGAGTGLNPFPGYQENAMARASAQRGLSNPNLSGLENQINLINKGPGYTDYLNDTSAKSLYKANSFEDYQLDQARRAAAEGAKLPSTVDMSLGRQSVPDYTSFEDSLHKSSITPDRFQNLEGLHVPDSGPYRIGSGDYLNNKETAFDIGRKAGEYFDKASKYVDDNPFKSAGLAYYGAYKTGMLDQPGMEAPKDNYKNPYSMVGFRRSSPNPSAYQYKPRYAQGGIASIHSYKKGGQSRTEAAMDFYDAMNPQPAAPLKHGDPGIYYDMDPDTRYLDPMEAAMVRMSKLNSRTNVQAPTMTPNRRMGELDFKPVAAARGGIMHFAEGGYSAPTSGSFAPGTEGVKSYAYDALARASQPSSLNLTAPSPINWNPNTPSTPVETPVTNAQSAGGGGGGGGYSNSPEGRAEREAQQDRLRAKLGEEGYAHRNDFIGEGLETLAKLSPTAMIFKALAGETSDESTGGPSRMQSPAAAIAASTEARAPVTETAPVAPAPVGITSIPSQFPSSPTVAPVPMMNITETYQGDDPNPPGDWTRTRIGRDDYRLTRTVSVPAETRVNPEDGSPYTVPVGYTGSGRVSSSDFGGGAVDPAGRDSSGAPLAKGGITSIHAPYNLGGYAAGGNPRLLRGPGDGMSDNIPATINNRQPARLADGEYVITADVVSHLGNGSTEAGAKQLDAMMKRIRKGRTGTSKQGKQIDPRKYLPA